MKRTQLNQRLAARVRGFMLIEVLVSILIFSIGVLALVGLQAKMTKAQSASKFRADAAYLSNELIGVMWSDVTNLGSYNGTGCAGYARCKDWQTKVSQNLPGGTGTVSSTASTGAVTITITWTQGSEDTHTFTTTSFVKS
jgi:type IV pilus assembly protein PilV